jgi:hypothetical protein
MATTLTCDPQAGVDSYILEGLGTITVGGAFPDGALNRDLGSPLLPGPYTTRAQACKGADCSDWSLPFTFTKPNILKATGLAIVRPSMLISADQVGMDRYLIDGLTGITTGAATATGGLSVSVQSLPSGNYTVKVKGCKDVWCAEAWSDPFPFVRSSVGPPASMRIVK